MGLTTSLITRELKCRPTHRRFYLYRLLVVFCGGMVVLAGYMIGGAAGSAASGLYLFHNLTFLSLIAACILATLSSAFLFARERKDGTLPLLFLTRITARDLLMAKFGMRLLILLLGLLSLMPIFVLMACLGGIKASQIVAAYGLLFCATFLSSCLGLLVASTARTEGGMLRLSGIMLGVMYLAIPAIGALACGMLSLAHDPTLGVLSPLWALKFISGFEVFSFSIWNSLLNITAGLLFLGAAWLFFRRNVAAGEWLSPRPAGWNSEEQLVKRVQRKRIQSSNPMTARELRSIFGSVVLARVMLWLFAILIALAFGAGALFHFLKRGGPSIGTIVGFLVCVVPSILFLSGLVYYCSQGFHAEKRSRVIELLMLTDLSVKEIFTGKLAAGYRALWPYFLATVLGLLVMGAMIDSQLVNISFGLYLNYLSMCVAYPLLALALSLRYSRFAVIGICTTVFIIWNVIGRLFISMVLFDTMPWTLGFVLDFVFHLELILVGSIIIESLFKKIQRGGTLWFQNG